MKRYMRLAYTAVITVVAFASNAHAHSGLFDGKYCKGRSIDAVMSLDNTQLDSQRPADAEFAYLGRSYRITMFRRHYFANHGHLSQVVSRHIIVTLAPPILSTLSEPVESRCTIPTASAASPLSPWTMSRSCAGFHGLFAPAGPPLARR